jgi:hypothetical protein
MESMRERLGLIEAPVDFFRGLRRKQLLPHYRGCGKFPLGRQIRKIFSSISVGVQ